MTYDCKDCKYNAFTWCIIRSQKSVSCDDCPMWKSDAPFGQNASVYNIYLTMTEIENLVKIM